MIRKKHIPPPFVLNEGHSLDINYDGYDDMAGSAENWKQYCTYQLLPDALKGHHQILQLHSMQIAYVQRPGGFMYDTSSPKDCFNFAVVEECADKACFESIKIHTGDIVFFDDSRSLNFMTNNAIKLCVVNIQKDKVGTLQPKISQALYHTIKDTDRVISKTLREIWKQFTSQDGLKKDSDRFRNTEEKIKGLLLKMLTEQTPTLPKLTKGEKIALKIRDQVYYHMDAKFDIDHLANEHKISKKTLHNGFKSLFGFSPGHFLRQMKLNLVHNELKKSNPDQTTVSRVAQKWGFTHMGHFSDYYAELFGEVPSLTLRRDYHGDIAIIEKSCVSRQEEMI